MSTPSLPPQANAQTLRQQAEALLAATPSDPGTAADAVRLLHELQVHQIELELQNEILLAARTEADSALARYTELYEFAPIPYLTLAANSQILNANQAAATLLATAKPALRELRLGAFIAEESRPQFNAFLAQALNSGQQESCELSLRVQGVQHWVVLQAQADHPRQALQLALLDITARKQAEENLKLAATVYQTLDEAIMVVDTSNRIIAINPAFTTLTGYSSEEALGQPANLLRSQRQEPAFYEAMHEALHQTGKWQGEICNRRKNGEEYFEWLTISTVYDDHGGVLWRVGVFSDITAWKHTADIIHWQANFDTLTCLPNRRLFQDRLLQELKKASRSGKKLAVMFLDLDRFKEINDTLGHSMGDVLLSEAAQRLTACMRESDTVARQGGDEFTAILSDLDDLLSIERAANCILHTMTAPFQLGQELGYISVSIGISIYPDDGESAEDLLKKADQAMYSAKSLGRNRYCFFTPALQEAAENRLYLANDLRRALPEGQFWVAYQPIVELASGAIYKAEALLRWQHPKRGLVSPAEFIPIAEETGLILEIGNWVFQQAVQQVRHWRHTLHTDIQISVNASPVQFKASPGCHSLWSSQPEPSTLDGKSIVIEITEGILMDTSSEIVDKLIAFRDAGMQVALDDFGTGYSSLSYLKKFDIDYLKIDQSFVKNLEPQSDDLILCQAIIVMAHKLGIKVIAEGIETQQQLDLLRNAGCDYGQGYLFSRPVPAAEFERLFE